MPNVNYGRNTCPTHISYLSQLKVPVDILSQREGVHMYPCTRFPSEQCNVDPVLGK